MNQYYFKDADRLMDFKECHAAVKKELPEKDYAMFQSMLRLYVK